MGLFTVIAAHDKCHARSHNMYQGILEMTLDLEEELKKKKELALKSLEGKGDL